MASSQKDANESIVISGISGRFPESNNFAEFRDNLLNGVDMVTENDRRWTPGLYGLPTRSGKLKNLDKFDASFFDVHTRQSNLMDPQLRILHEVTYEAIMDSGIDPSTLRGSNTGVFVGVSQSDGALAWVHDPTNLNGYGLLGCSISMIANRISYSFDFKGPSFPIDTACSSSMVALHQAVGALRNGHCNSAIVAGVNICLAPIQCLQSQKLGMLSFDGKCKAFDASADGYAKSEAAVAIYVQWHKHSRRFYAKILHIATNTDGYKKNGVTFPSGELQQILLEQAYAHVGINPLELAYMEGHVTGTKAGDPQEVRAIAAALCKNRNSQSPLLVGSVKSNMGHSEPAAGLCNIAKIIVAIQSQTIPGNLHYNKPNPEIEALLDGRVKVVAQNTPWQGGLIGLNSFGFGGSNVHVILQSNDNTNQGHLSESLPILNLFSARTQEGVEVALQQLQTGDQERAALLNEIIGKGLPAHSHRGYAISLRDEQLSSDIENQENAPERRSICLIFSGMGSQWPGMGLELLKFPTFASSLKKCAQVLAKQGINLMEILHDSGDQVLTNVQSAFVCVTSIQVALVDLLTSVGIKSDQLIGHSLGELACSYADGSFTAEQAVLSAASRGQAILESPGVDCAMAAIGMSWEEAVKRCPQNIYPACHNAVDNVTVAGPKKLVEEFTGDLKSQGIFAKLVNSCNQAFHCTYQDEAAIKLGIYMRQYIPQPQLRTKKWVSSCIEKSQWSCPLAKTSSPEYHVTNLTCPVLFHEALQEISDTSIVIEIGPSALFPGLLKRALPKCIILSLTGRPHDKSGDALPLLNVLGKLFNLGFNLTLDTLYKKMEFPVSIKCQPISPLISTGWDHGVSWNVPKFENGASGDTFVDISLDKAETEFYGGHKIIGKIFFPATGYLHLVWTVMAQLQKTSLEKLPIIFENVSFHRPTILEKNGGKIRLHINLLRGSQKFEILQDNFLVVTGSVSVDVSDENGNPAHIEEPIGKVNELNLNGRDIYKELRLRGYQYEREFKGLLTIQENGEWGLIKWRQNWVTFLDNMLQLAIFSTRNLLYLPNRIQKIYIDPRDFTQQLQMDETEVKVFYKKNLNRIYTRGVQINGLQVRSLTSKVDAIEPILNICQFTPYDSEINNNLNNCLHLFATILAENLSLEMIKIFEFAPLTPDSSILSPLLVPIIRNIPEIYCIADIYMENKETLTEKTNGVQVVQNLGKLDNYSLIIIHNLNNFNQSTIPEKAFVLYHIKNEQTTPPGLQIVARHQAGETELILMRKESTQKLEFSFIDLDQDFDFWIEKFKTLSTEGASNPSKRLIFHSKNATNGIIGFIKCLRKEPDGDWSRSYFFKNWPEELNFENPALQTRLNLDLVMNVYQNSQWGSYCHYPLESKEASEVKNAYANILSIGDLSTLTWIEDQPLSKIDPESKICNVAYSALNFRDIMLAFGNVSTDVFSREFQAKECLLGVEFSGTTPEGVRLMGVMPPPCFATQIICDSLSTWEVPSNWSLADAATVPMAYSTAYYSLVIRGKIQEGESILIHSGSGALGQAAITIALSMNCTVYTSVGSQEKKKYLKNLFPLKDENFTSSRDCSFETHVLTQTKGAGVDLVLNSLTGSKLDASVRCLTDGGRFLEVGKLDLIQNSSLGMAVFLKNISFHGILVDNVYFTNKTIFKELRDCVANGIKSGVVKPLSRTIFKKSELQQSFRYMLSGKHVGKVLVEMGGENLELAAQAQPDPPTIGQIYFEPDKSYIVVGGLGGFGMEFCSWMIKRGARKLVLVSRSKVQTGYQTLCIQRWREKAHIILSNENVATIRGAQNLISANLNEIAGIFNLAMVLQDGLLTNQTAENFEEALIPKLNASRCLDNVTRELALNLKWFVIFSSAVSGYGRGGQTNYGYANAGCEQICENRRKNGLHGLAIQWGAIGDVGIVHETMGDNVIVGGTLSQGIRSCLTALDSLLRSSCAVAGSMTLPDKSQRETSTGAVIETKRSVTEQVAYLLGVKDITKVSVRNSTFQDFGMDSLIAVEVQQLLKKEFQMTFTSPEIRQLSFSKVSEMEEKIGGKIQTTESVQNEETKIQEIMPKKCLVQLPSKSVQNKAIYFIHPIGGLVTSLENLAQNLNFPVYGLQCVEEAPLNSVGELADFYINKINEEAPKEEEFFIGGYSFGCLIAVEMALKLQKMSLLKGHFGGLIFLDGSHISATISMTHYMTRTNLTVEKANENEIDAGAMCAFLLQFVSFEYKQVHADLLKEKSLDQKIILTAKLLIARGLCVTPKDAEAAAKSFYNKIMMAWKYTPSSKIQGNSLLIQSQGNLEYKNLGHFYGLDKICDNVVQVQEVNGNHESFLEAPNVTRVAEIVNKFCETIEETKPSSDGLISREVGLKSEIISKR